MPRPSLPAFVLAVCATAVLGTRSVASEAPQARTVIIIGVDGLSPRGVDVGETPALNELLERGAYSFTARGVFPTSSSPNWASMISGAGPEQHGVTSNDWRLWNRAILPSADDDGKPTDPMFPTVFSELRRQRPDAFIAAVYDWSGFGTLFQKDAVDVDADTQGPEATMERAVRVFREDRPHLLFIHLDHVDGAGHGEGWHTPAYYDAVLRADQLIGQMIDAITERDAWDTTLVIVTSDHGGVDRSHGGETMAELEIPWIIAGAGVEPGREITRPIDTSDTACTAAYALGLEQHPAWVGRPVFEAFRDGSYDGWRPSTYLPGPRVDPPGALLVADSVTVTIACEDPSATIRYTTDGSEPNAESPVYTRPVVLGETATLRTRAFKGTRASRVTTDAFRLLSPASPRPVEFTYFENPAPSNAWTVLPDFDALTPVRTGHVPEVGLAFIDRRADQFAVRFRARVRVGDAGTHVFHLTSDDGSRLWVNRRRLIDNDGSHGPLERSGVIDLTPGTHEIVVEYFEDHGGESLELAVTGPDRVRVPLSFDRLERP
jgi:hypothetical protein